MFSSDGLQIIYMAAFFLNNSKWKADGETSDLYLQFQLVKLLALFYHHMVNGQIVFSRSLV